MRTVFYTDEFDAKSNAMHWVYYDKPNQVLYIEWNNSNLSAYNDVTQAMYDSFKEAPSKGVFYNRNIYKSSAWLPGDGNVILRPASNVLELMTNTVDPLKSRTSYEVTLVVESDSIADAVAHFPNEFVVAVRRV